MCRLKIEAHLPINMIIIKFRNCHELSNRLCDAGAGGKLVATDV